VEISDQSAVGGRSVRAGAVDGAMSYNDLPVSPGRCQRVVQPRLHRCVVVHPLLESLGVDDDDVQRVIGDVLDVVVPQVRLMPAPLVLR